MRGRGTFSSRMLYIYHGNNAEKTRADVDEYDRRCVCKRGARKCVCVCGGGGAYVGVCECVCAGLVGSSRGGLSPDVVGTIGSCR